MKKYLGILAVLAILVLPVASAVTDNNNYAGTSWERCNVFGNYGGWDKESDCYVAWDGVDQICEESNRDAYFTVGTEGYTVTKITIVHLDGIAETMDSFEVYYNDAKIEGCEFVDAVAGPGEEWETLECNVNVPGGSVLRLHPTASAPWSACGTWGQVAISSISYEQQQNQIPEFTAVAAGLALLGSGAAFVALRKRK